MTINIDDFRHIRRGKVLKSLSKEQANWLKSIHQTNHKKTRALLMLHGFSSSPAVFRLLLPKISQHYDTIVSPALPGHATDLTHFATVKASDWITAAEDACQELLNQYEKVDVLGLSLGGLLATHLGSQFNLNHLYLLAPALNLKINLPLAINLAKFLKKLGFNQLRNQAGNLVSDETTEIAYRKLPISTIIEILTLIKEFKYNPPTSPVDVFLGQYDRVVNSEQVEKYFEALNQATIHWLKNSAHVLPLDKDIDIIAECINQNQ